MKLPGGGEKSLPPARSALNAETDGNTIDGCVT